MKEQTSVQVGDTYQGYDIIQTSDDGKFFAIKQVGTHGYDEFYVFKVGVENEFGTLLDTTSIASAVKPLIEKMRILHKDSDLPKVEMSDSELSDKIKRNCFTLKAVKILNKGTREVLVTFEDDSLGFFYFDEYFLLTKTKP
jgi:hypothetical protein